MGKINFVYLFSFMLLLLIGCKGYYMFKHTPDWWANKAETTATVISVHHAPETTFQYEFFVDGKAYKGGYAFYENVDMVVVGSKYKVAYNPLNPTQNYIMLHNPIFEDNENVAYSIGVVSPGISVYYAKQYKADLYKFTYTFYVNEKRYRAIEGYFLNINGSEKKDFAKKKFKVKYWVENPWRSIILLDEPVED